MSLPLEVSFLASKPGKSRNGREVRVLRVGKGREGLDRLEHLFLVVYGGFVLSELLGKPPKMKQLLYRWGEALGVHRRLMLLHSCKYRNIRPCGAGSVEPVFCEMSTLEL